MDGRKGNVRRVEEKIEEGGKGEREGNWLPLNISNSKSVGVLNCGGELSEP